MFGKLRSRLRRPSPGTALGLGALVVAVGGAAYASIPGPDGVIKGCYATTEGIVLGIPHSKGDTRIVDSAENCRSYEKTLSWNQKGPKGDKGDQGPPGPAAVPDVLRKATSVDAPPGRSLNTIDCPENFNAVSGGFDLFPADQIILEASFPLGGPTWKVVVDNRSASSRPIGIYVLCIPAP